MLTDAPLRGNRQAKLAKESARVFRIQLDLEAKNCDGWIEALFTRIARIKRQVWGHAGV
jgi:hypothetical protein